MENNNYEKIDNVIEIFRNIAQKNQKIFKKEITTSQQMSFIPASYDAFRSHEWKR